MLENNINKSYEREDEIGGGGLEGREAGPGSGPVSFIISKFPKKIQAMQGF